MRRCVRCDVMWRGLPLSPCWCCGGLGEHAWLPPMDMRVPFEASDRAVRGDGIEPPTVAV